MKDEGRGGLFTTPMSKSGQAPEKNSGQSIGIAPYDAIGNGGGQDARPTKRRKGISAGYPAPNLFGSGR